MSLRFIFRALTAIPILLAVIFAFFHSPIAMAAPDGPHSVRSAPLSNGVWYGNNAYQSCLDNISDYANNPQSATCNPLIPGSLEPTKVVNVTAPSTCPTDGVQTDISTSLSSPYGSSQAITNVYCGVAESGKCWYPPKLTMPWDTAPQTGLDYTKGVGYGC